ncbi:MAG: DUF4261 domain-containing protein [Planctomycetes bacterium]|nr:DUF4261 domain-containing protein [Planctomycetota bacterium]
MARSVPNSTLDPHEGPYFIELLYAEPPSIPKADLFDALKDRCPGIAPLVRDADSDLLAFVHTRHSVRYRDGTLPAQCLIAESSKPTSPDRLVDAVRQSWRFPEVESLIEDAGVSMLVSDLMASGLPHKDRLGLFQQCVAAVLETAMPLAIHWSPTQQIIPPRAYLDAVADPSVHLFARPGALNVRLFRITGYDGAEDASCEDLLMDTLGLAALGLPDLQCHFRRLEPNDVSHVLYNTAIYLFDEGPVIETGHTIAGVREDDRWECRGMEAIWKPAREVLDIDPGPRHSARRGT